ncbi:MAG: hypothetical protein H0W88_04480 [Parachlamydiaceae bacterium]|nr:hypothetical protein [Parachlamydiaceae bacterium]
MYIFKLMILIFFSSTLYQNIFADCPAENCEEYKVCSPRLTQNHIFYAGPEIYYVNRLREKGAKQKGWVYGGRVGYDRIKRNRIYWGLDAVYAGGRLHGHSSKGSELKSNFYDANIEGRIGYTFQQKRSCRIFVTPFLGGGYGEETNNFVHPSPLTIHTQIKYGYVCGGFLSGMSVGCDWFIGLNFKAKYLIDAKNKISHDSEFDDVTMRVKNEMQYRVELPVVYKWCYGFDFGVVPFYEYRHYGQQVNFPFDFIETKLNIYGATFKLIYNL